MPVTINGSNTPTAGGVTYGDGTQYATTSAGTSGQALLSAGAGAPTWGTPASATTATNLAGGSAGVVPYQTGSGATAFTAAGTSGQVLTSAGTGTPTWSTPSAGALTLLATVTPTASATSIDFLNTFSSTYDNYLVICNGLQADSSTDTLAIQFANGGVVDTNTRYGSTPFANNTNLTASQGSASISANVTSTANAGGANLHIQIMNVNSTGYAKSAFVIAETRSATAYTTTAYQVIYQNTSATVSGFRLLFSTLIGFAAAGKVRVYGYSNS